MDYKAPEVEIVDMEQEMCPEYLISAGLHADDNSSRYSNN
jgi:hypothetical protein